MNQLRRSRLVALVAGTGAALVLAAAPSPAAGPDRVAPLPDLNSVADLVKERRPGTAGMPKQRPAPERPAPQAPPTRGWAPTPPPAAPTAAAPAPTTPAPAAPKPTPTPTPPAPAPRPTPPPTPPTPTPTHPPVQGPRVPTAPSGPSELMARVVELTNRDRAQHGCAPLTPQAALAAAAQGHADDMSRQVYFSHTSLDGRTFDRRIRDAGYPGHQFGENIASGFPTAEEVQEAWMSTPGHRRNILDCSFREIGVGYADEGEFWVVNFGA